ncbi:apolipoprotein N-acyltransferase [Mycolicibacterium sp. BK556]|uniref:apolipoprotein N-acyltransferase n=1 Tax=unclassified Mycolicibacterium TaxID=2636767 RepID=UPI00161A8D83|nr:MULTISPECIES: apolipoprotein N-acyltransferase [unclassified Mycolicibacterium]MBB3603631.1 apolipoprotein N-acyltransferase [Mycolicibacterium sp. BK556]MBB3633826.1 apolipoprotein N-acyltransferase [Mycolicibacterium sp. BK607]
MGSRLLTWLRTALPPRMMQLLVAVTAGLLLCISFPPIGWWWSAVLSFAMFSWVLLHPKTTAAGGLGYGFLFGLAFYIPLIPWISGLVGPVPWLALSAMEALFPALFGWLAVVVRRLPGWPLWLALMWSLQEWLKSTIPFGGFPWGVVGFGQTGGPFLSLVQLGGVPLLSFGIVLLGTSLAALVLEVVHWWLRSAESKEKDHVSLPGVLLPGLCITAVLLTTAVAAPQVRRAAGGAGNEPTVTVAAIQGNVPRLGLDFNAQRRAVLDNHVRQTVQLAEDVHAGRAPQPQFVIWPENSSDIDPYTNTDAAQQISVAAQAIGAPILVGTVVARPDWTPENPAASNTVVVWDPVGGPGERHDKQIIQPFGEYLPWRGFFRHLSSFADRAGYFVPGNGSGVVHAAGVPVGVATCWEVIFDRALRESVLGGAQVLAVPTNNATFDRNMSEQLLAFARARAVEHDRYVVVAGTVGISAVIAPDGHELSRTEFFTPGYLDMTVRLKTSQTPATRWGPLVQWVLVGAAIAIVLAVILHNGWFMRPFRRSKRQRDADSTSGGGDDGDNPPEQGESSSALAGQHDEGES